MRYTLYHVINGLWSGIPLCCIKFWCDGNDGATRKAADPLWGWAQYVRCDSCVTSGKIVRIRHNGSICHWLYDAGGPWYVPGLPEAGLDE